MENEKYTKIIISVGVAVLLVFSVITAAMAGVSGEAEAPAVEEEDIEALDIDLEELLSNMNRDPTDPVDQLDVMDPEITQILSGGDASGERLMSSDGPGLMTDPHTIDQHNVEAVHDMGIYGDGVQVSLMDTGFDMAHPDLIGTHAVFEYEDDMPDEYEMYDGYPIAFDPVSMADYAFDGEISYDYHVWEELAPGLMDSSWYVDTTYETTTYEDDGDIVADFTEKEEDLTYTMPDGVEAEETVRFGLHPDEKLHTWYEERPAVLLTQNGDGDWTNVYVDLLNDREFKEESRARIDGGDPESEVITKDLNDDGIADVSGGMVYFVSDGEKPIPYSQNFRETINNIINLYMGYPPGTIEEEYGVDGWQAITGQDEFYTTPGDGEMIALMGDFNSFGAYGAHGTWTASAVAGQGVTGVPEEMLEEGYEGSPYPPGEPGEGLPRGLAPDAEIIPMGRFFDYLPEENPLGIAQAQVPITYSSIFFTADGYTGDPTITSDSADIASSSFGRTIDENHGGLNFYERMFDYVGTQYTENTLFINSQGNEGSGFGTVSAPSGAQGVLSAGASGNQLYRVDEWNMYDGGPNPWYGEVTGMTSTGPHSKGSHGPDIMTNGQFGYGGDPLNNHAEVRDADGNLVDMDFQGNNSWTLWSGTSLSAPNAAGIAALVYQAYEEAHGEAPDAETLKNIIMQGADDMNNSPHLQGPGEANAYDSVKIAQGEGLYSEEFQWRPGTNPDMDQHVEHHVNMMEAGETQTEELALHNWNEDDDIDYEMNTYKQEKVSETQIELESGRGGPHFDGRVPLVMIDETGVYDLSYNRTNDNWEISDEPIAELDDPDADLLRFGTHTPYENQGMYDYSLAEFYNWEDVKGNGRFDGWDERNRIGYSVANMAIFEALLGWEVPTSDYFTIHDALERAEDGIVVQMNNVYWDFMEEPFEFTLNIEQYNQVEWDWIEIDEPEGTINAGDTLEYDITADVPSEAIKGIYGGKLMIEDLTNGRTHPIPITITVGEYTDLSEPMKFGAAEGEDEHGIYRNDRLYGSWEGGLTGDWRFYTFHLEETVENVRLSLDFGHKDSDMTAYLLGGAEQDMLEIGDPYDGDPFSLMLPERYGTNTLETMDGTYYDYGDSESFVPDEELDAGTYMIAVQSHQISGHEPYQEFYGEIGEGIDRVELDPEDDLTIEAGETLDFSAVAYDGYGNEIEDDEQLFDWENAFRGNFRRTQQGEYEVTATYEGVTSEPTIVTVEPAETDYVMIDPAENQTIEAGETIDFSAEAYDEHNNLITDDDEDFTWTNTDETGLFDETEAGEYEVTATHEEVTSELVVVTVLNDHFEVDITEYDAEVEEGEMVTVEFTVENTGNVEGTQDIVLSLDGDEVDAVEMTIGAGETEQNELTWEAEDAGDYELEVASEDDEDTVTVTVEEEEVEEPIDRIREELEAIPGFTSVLLILGSVIAVAVYHKKEQ